MIPYLVHKWLAGIIFVGCYVAIASDKADKTKVVLLGASLMLLLGVVSQEQAFGGLQAALEAAQRVAGSPEPITDAGTEPLPPTESRHEAVSILQRSGLRNLPGADWNTILLLIGMMIVVDIVGRTGVFQWMAIKSAKLAKGDPLRITLILCTITATVSAGLDNVTTVLLTAPIALVVAETVGISPVPMLICQVLASNIGGTATLIGDPPNIIIASQARLPFNAFLANLSPVIVIVMVVFLLTLRWTLRKQLTVSEEAKQKIMAFDENKAITDPRLLRKCKIVLVLIFTGFVIHNRMGWEPATVALSGAALLLLLSGLEAPGVLEKVEWPTIFFFLGLFIMVGGLVRVGIIRDLSVMMVDLFGSSIPVLAMVMLWFSAIVCSLFNNIAFVTAMCPLLLGMADHLGLGIHSPEMMAVWWALALGACLGGNATIIGSAANMVVAGISRRAGHPIGFMEYVRYSAPLTLQTLVISAIYLWVFYLRSL